MTEREKVIKGMKHCIGDNCSGDKWYECEYSGHGCIDALLEDALTMLKAQEPRVMTLEEIPERQETTGWLEWRDGDFYAAILYANDLKVDYMKFCTSCAFMKNEYGVTVRCWTSRPTDEQREATPWES